MAQSTRPASANGECPAGYPRRRATGQEFGRRRGRSCRSQGLEPRQWRGGRSPRQPHTGLEAVAATWFGEIWSRAHRLGEGRAAVADAGPDLIHDLRIYVRRLCALSDLLPRPPGARPMRRALRKVAWAMQPLSRARDWDVFTMEVLPQLCDADPDIDPQASAARAAPLEIAHDEMYANLQTERFQAMLRLLRERSAGSPPPWPSARPGRCIARSAAASRGWDAALRARLDNAADQGPRRQQHARGSASNACAMPARRCCCSVHPASSSATSRPWPTCKARWAARRTSVQPPRWGAMCVSACRPAGWRVG